MLSAEQYNAKLQLVLKEIKSLFDLAEIRGNDVASFIYAEKQNRAVEVYQSDGSVIIEFWENDEQLKEKEASSYEKAAEIISDWMNSDI